MSCHQCTRAEANPLAGMYQADCPNCMARAFAHGQAMFDRDSRRKLEIDCGVDTRQQIETLGQWPANLPKLQGHP